MQQNLRKIANQVVTYIQVLQAKNITKNNLQNLNVNWNKVEVNVQNTHIHVLLYFITMQVRRLMHYEARRLFLEGVAHQFKNNQYNMHQIVIITELLIYSYKKTFLAIFLASLNISFTIIIS
ncbi:Hypothetical_protein [Hexamita inflata]|uniref:Hypothetical_protein n=1 Tax=Hexamita inflata TaxID=28002 RepID=A0AA86NSE9_9EUKA|nr:Hypothetical protein HINF_LOCUS11299 [Hexamita inflata]CAI9925642.1 Hypothetical protein HINF_LOCUS13287 [Hexamita inflata]